MALHLDLNYQYRYGKWHDDTDEHRASMMESYRKLFAPHLANVRRGAALDIGCGQGFALEFLKGSGFDPVWGFDADEGQLEACRKRGLNVIRSETLDPLMERPYSLITAIDVLEHISPEESVLMLRKAYAALEPGGLFLCRVPNANSALAERWRFDDFTHLTTFTENSLDFLLLNAGFKDSTFVAGELPRKMPLPFRVRSFASWLNFKVTRGFRRMQLIAELEEAGRKTPLSLNLLGIARK
ncbi:MAG: class I SAM-dependent methyltransferase [Endomicrobiales bacterium]